MPLRKMENLCQSKVFTYALLEGVAGISRFALASKPTRCIRANGISTAPSGRSVYRVALVYVCEQRK